MGKIDERRQAMESIVGLWQDRKDLDDSEAAIRKLRRGNRLVRLVGNNNSSLVAKVKRSLRRRARQQEKELQGWREQFLIAHLRLLYLLWLYGSFRIRRLRFV